MCQQEAQTPHSHGSIITMLTSTRSLATTASRLRKATRSKHRARAWKKHTPLITVPVYSQGHSCGWKRQRGAMAVAASTTGRTRQPRCRRFLRAVKHVRHVLVLLWRPLFLRVHMGAMQMVQLHSAVRACHRPQSPPQHCHPICAAPRPRGGLHRCRRRNHRNWKRHTGGQRHTDGICWLHRSGKCLPLQTR